MKLSFVVSAEFDEEAPVGADTLKYYADKIRETLDLHDCGQAEDFDVEPLIAPDPIAAAVDATLDPVRKDLIAFGHKLAKQQPDNWDDLCMIPAPEEER
jgi:hypothetical protein